MARRSAVYLRDTSPFVDHRAGTGDPEDDDVGDLEPRLVRSGDETGGLVPHSVYDPSVDGAAVDGGVAGGIDDRQRQRTSRLLIGVSPPEGRYRGTRFRGRHDVRPQLQSRHEAVRSLGCTPTKGGRERWSWVEVDGGGKHDRPVGVDPDLLDPCCIGGALAPFARSMRGCSDIPLYLV